MKAPKRPAAQLDVPDDDLDDEYSPPDLDFYNKRTELLDAGDSGSIRVYREGPGGYRDLTFVRGFSLSEFEPEMLQAPPFNGGRFRIHMLGAGRGAMRANFLFKVEPLPGSKPLDGVAAPAAVVDSTATLLAAMQSGFEKIAAALATAHAPAVKQGLGVEDAIKLISALSAIQPPPRSENGLSGLKQLTEIMGVIEEIRGPVDGDGKVSMLGVVSRALDKIAAPLGDVISSVARKKLKENPQALAALTGDAAEPATGAAMSLDDQLKMFLPMLIAQAAADNDPTTYAEMLLDNMPAAQIRPMIERADWFDELMKLDPRVAPHREWFNELRELVVEGLTPEPEAGKKGASAPESGDAPTGGEPTS